MKIFFSKRTNYIAILFAFIGMYLLGIKMTIGVSSIIGYWYFLEFED